MNGKFVQLLSAQLLVALVPLQGVVDIQRGIRLQYYVSLLSSVHTRRRISVEPHGAALRALHLRFNLNAPWHFVKSTRALTHPSKIDQVAIPNLYLPPKLAAVSRTSFLHILRSPWLPQPRTRLLTTHRTASKTFHHCWCSGTFQDSNNASLPSSLQIRTKVLNSLSWSCRCPLLVSPVHRKFPGFHSGYGNIAANSQSSTALILHVLSSTMMFPKWRSRWDRTFLVSRWADDEIEAAIRDIGARRSC